MKYLPLLLFPLLVLKSCMIMSTKTYCLTKDSAARYNNRLQTELKNHLEILNKLNTRQNEILRHCNDDSIQYYQHLYDQAITENRSVQYVLAIENKQEELKQEAARKVFNNMSKLAKMEMDKIYAVKYDQRKENELLEIQNEREYGMISENKFMTLSDSIRNRIYNSPVTDANAVELMMAYGNELTNEINNQQANFAVRLDSIGK
jgi:hypothetical protein